MAKLGEILRAQREKKGITLDQAAADTRIREKFLKALEDADYQQLPGAVYTRGFLRNYAEYLDLDQEELVVLFHEERGTAGAEPTRTFRPMRPIMRRSLIFTPTVLVPVLVLAGIALFVGYLYYQFTSFAVAPSLDVYDPATDAIAQESQYVLHGRTVPAGRVTVQVFPGPMTLSDIHPAADGTFSATVNLTPGANHVVVEVLDQSGKVSRVSRSILLQPAVAATAAPLRLTIDTPANGARVENAGVRIAGTVDPSATSLTINGATMSINPGGRFESVFNLLAGTQTLTIVERTASGATATETRTVTVVYTSAVVTVFVSGGDAWVQATVDGSVAAGTGRVFKDGETATFVGKQVVLRSGNGGATKVTYNGLFQGALGSTGEVVEKVYTAQ
ncbi:MAG TPA: helix-turn-helix domain-containing protein [Methylomirabilota bacterium]|nr:helix-turn-helix domain-containing protein [Methylomirabilota bacterium]